MLEVPNNITRADVAFGNISHMPKYSDVPEEFKRSSNIYADAVSDWFFRGAKGHENGIQIGEKVFTAKPGVNAAQALAAIKSVLGSFEPKHEHKEAACAYMLSEWFNLEKQVGKKR